MLNIQYLFFILIFLSSCGVKGPPKAPPGTALSPWVDSYFYTPKITPTPAVEATTPSLDPKSNELIHTTGSALDQNLIKPSPTPMPTPIPSPINSEGQQ